MRDRLAGDFLAVHSENSCATFAHTGPVIFEIKHNGVFTRRERLRAFPAEQSEQVVGEDRLAFNQVKAVTKRLQIRRDYRPAAAKQPPPSGQDTM